MNKTLKKGLYSIAAIVTILVVAGLILAYLPSNFKVKHKGITPEIAAELRQKYTQPHHKITTSDGEILFLRRWNTDSTVQTHKDCAVLLLHGITAYGGPGEYNTACTTIAKGGYTTFALDYRGHGLSGGNRGDNPSKQRWLADFTETVAYIKSLGYSKVILFGHSLGVASSIFTAMNMPDQLSGLILLSGAYEGKKKAAEIPFFQKAKLISSAVFRPSFQAVEYYREGMTVTEDSLFTFRYTVRFVSMLDVKELKLPKTMNIPILVGVGDKDELFDVDKVKVFYDDMPGSKKEFLILKDAYHAKFPVDSWEKLVEWLNKNY